YRPGAASARRSRRWGILCALETDPRQSMQECETPFGVLTLDRYPPTANPTLQAWDAADLHMLQQCHPGTGGRVLVINDNFGSLACALARGGCQVTSWSDSFLAERALRLNLERNTLAAEQVDFVDSQQLPIGPVDRVLLRIPKSLALLEDQLSRLRPLLGAGLGIVAEDMLKPLSMTAGDLLVRYVVPYQASLALNKTRLLMATTSEGLAPEIPGLVARYELADT